MSQLLPFSFARKNELVLSTDLNVEPKVFYTQNTPLMALLEVQRRLLEVSDDATLEEECAQGTLFERLSDDAFEKKIQTSYANSGQNSMESIPQREFA